MINYAIVDDTYGQVIAEDKNRNPFNLDNAIEFAQMWRDGLKPEYRANVRVVELVTRWPDDMHPHPPRADSRRSFADSDIPDGALDRALGHDNTLYNVRTDFNP